MGKKKNKVVDLKPESISSEQLAELQQIVSGINKLQFDIGSIEFQKQNVLHTLFEGTTKLQSIRKSILEQYGTNNVDIQTGAINYEPDGESSNT